MRTTVLVMGLILTAGTAFGECTLKLAKEKAEDAAKAIDAISYSYDDEVSVSIRQTKTEDAQWVLSTVVTKPGQLGGNTWSVTVGNKNCFIYHVKMGVSEETPGKG